MARKESERPKNIIQSYLVTSAKYDFNVYEKRILYRIVELLQCELEGKSLGRGISIEPTLYNDRVVSMPVHHFLRAGEMGYYYWYRNPDKVRFNPWRRHKQKSNRARRKRKAA